MKEMIFVAYSGDRPLSDKLWRAVLGEYRRNGGRMVSPGKLRWLRRQLRRRIRVNAAVRRWRPVPVRYGQNRVRARPLAYWSMQS